MFKLAAVVTGIIAFVGLVICVIAGWWMNIVALATAAAFGPLEVVRAFGIILFPVGAFLGWAY